MQSKATLATLFLLSLAIGLKGATYYYDEAGRLSQAAYNDGKGVAYLYDSNDNLLSQTSIAIPPKPEGVLASVNPDSGIALEWDQTASATSYRIYRRSHANLVWTEIATTDASTFAFIDTSVAKDVDYYYRIVAVNTNGFSAYSEGTLALTLASKRLTIHRLRRADGSPTYNLVFTTQEGASYRIEQSSDLTEDSWTIASHATEIEGPQSQTDIIATSAETNRYLRPDPDQLPKFFRIRELD